MHVIWKYKGNYQKEIKMVTSEKKKQKKQWGKKGRELLTVSYGKIYSTLKNVYAFVFLEKHIF